MPFTGYATMPESQWAPTAVTHERSLSGRISGDGLAKARALTAVVTDETRWRGAYLCVSGCTEDEPARSRAPGWARRGLQEIGTET
jgi:hypothetical protein